MWFTEIATFIYLSQFLRNLHLFDESWPFYQIQKILSNLESD